MDWFFLSSFVYLTATDFREGPRYFLAGTAAVVYGFIYAWFQTGLLYSGLLTFLALEILYRALFLYLFMAPVSFMYHLTLQQKIVWNLVLFGAFYLVYWCFQSVTGFHWFPSCLASFILVELLLRVLCLICLRGL